MAGGDPQLGAHIPHGADEAHYQLHFGHGVGGGAGRVRRGVGVHHNGRGQGAGGGGGQAGGEVLADFLGNERHKGMQQAQGAFHSVRQGAGGAGGVQSGSAGGDIRVGIANGGGVQIRIDSCAGGVQIRIDSGAGGGIRVGIANGGVPINIANGGGVGISVVPQADFRHLNIPVAEVVPDEIVEALLGLAELEGGEGAVDGGGGCVQAVDNPAILAVGGIS